MLSDKELINLIDWLYRILSVLCPLIVLILGVIITCIKGKLVKLLGIACMADGIKAVFLNSILLAMATGHLGEKEYSDLLGVNSYLQWVLILINTVCICLFLKRRYGARVMLPCVLLLAGQLVIPLLVANGLFRADIIHYPEEHIRLISLLLSLFSIASGVIIIRAFLKNRSREDLIPRTGMLMIFQVAFLVIYAALYLFEVIYIHISGNIWDYSNAMVRILSFIGLAVSLILPIYLVSRPGREVSGDER